MERSGHVEFRFFAYLLKSKKVENVEKKAFSFFGLYKS